MAILNVCANKTELNNLKRKLASARHSSQLLKNRLGELTEKLAILVADIEPLSLAINEKFDKANLLMQMAAGEMTGEQMNFSLMGLQNAVEIETTQESFLGYTLPDYKLKQINSELETPYSLAFTSFSFDEAIEVYNSISDDLVSFTQIKEQYEILSDKADEIKNEIALLENSVIKDCEDTIKHISSKIKAKQINSAIQKVFI